VLDFIFYALSMFRIDHLVKLSAINKNYFVFHYWKLLYYDHDVYAYFSHPTGKPDNLKSNHIVVRQLGQVGVMSVRSGGSTHHNTDEDDDELLSDSPKTLTDRRWRSNSSP